MKRRNRGRRVTGPGRRVRTRRLRPGRRGPRTVRARRRLARVAGALGSRHPAARRVLVAVALLAAALFPLPGLAADTPSRPPGCQGNGCRAQLVSALRWTVGLPGTWSAGTGPGTTGDGGTVPAFGEQAYVAVGGEIAVLGTGLSVTGYSLSHGKYQWQTMLGAPDGTQIMSVRAWPGVVTVGLLAPGGRSRTEVVLDATTGDELRRYPAAEFGGAVAASKATTVIVGSAAVTSYNNANGRVRWTRGTGGVQSWQADGQTLYLAESAGGYLGSSPVTALGVIHLATGAEQMLSSPLGSPFSGTLAAAAAGVVLFASPAGLTAYSGSTGGALWTMPGAVPEGTDPEAGQVDVTGPGGALTSIDPRTQAVRATVPASAGAASLYVVRNEVALGLSGGGSGTAFLYSMARNRVTWTAPGLPWPHFFSDLSGLGGSAAVSGGTVVVAACPHLAATPGLCADPELVALNL